VQTRRNTSTGKAATGRQRRLAPRHPAQSQLTQPGKPPRTPRWLRWCGWGLLGTLIVSALALLSLHLRLAQGPIVVDFLLRPLEAALNREIAPLRMQIGRTVLRYEEKSFSLGLRLNDIRITDERGSPVATAPFAAVSMSTSALLQGTLAPTRVDLLQPKLLLTVTADNQLSFRAARTVTSDAASADGTSLTTEAPVSGTELDKVLNQLVTEAFGTAGSGASAIGQTSYLSSLGLRDALLVLDFHGTRSIWGVPAFVVKRSTDVAKADQRVQAKGAIVTGSGTFDIDADMGRQANGSYGIGVTVRDLVPSDLGDAIPALAALRSVSTPIAVKSHLTVSAGGQVLGLDADISTITAPISTQADCAAGLSLDAAQFRFQYARDKDIIEVLPSAIATNIGRASVAGQIRLAAANADDQSWQFDVNLTEASLGSADPAFAAVSIPSARLRGGYDPATKQIGLDRLNLPLGEGTVDVAGRITTEGSLQLEAIVRRVDQSILKRIWPNCLAEPARDWIRQNIQSGRIDQATVRIGLADFVTPSSTAAALPTSGQVVIEGTIADLAFTAIRTLPPVAASLAKFTLNNSALRISTPTAVMKLSSDRQLVFRESSFEIPDTAAAAPAGRFTGDISSSLESAVAVLGSEPLNLLQPGELQSLSGKQTGSWIVDVPLLADLKTSDVTLRGKAKVRELRTLAAKPSGAPALQGGAIDLAVDDGVVALTGDVLLNGVNFKLSGKRPFAQSALADQAEPLTFTAKLDDADRDQLGIRINHIVRGDITVIAQLAPNAASMSTTSPPPMLVSADLSAAELVLDTMAWRKPPGASAQMSVTVVPQADGSVALDAFRLTGAEIGVGGSLILNRNQQLQSFNFDDFSIDVITRLTLSGKRRADNVLDVRAQGATFDGRKLLRSLFSAGRITERDLPPPRDTEGIDLTVDIGTMVGIDDTSLRQVTAKLSRRKGRLTALEASGTLDGGGALAVRLPDTPQGPRTLYVEAKDAGRAFKLVGLYRNLEGGEASLKVDLDGGTKDQKSGILWARRFVVLGDAIVDEVLTRSQNDESAPTAPSRRKGPPKRARLQFDTMRVPFQVGQGRLELLDMFINGPVLGATLRGLVDFERRDVRLAGTYVPLYGLNALLGEVPLFGPLLVGRSGEGVFGITFAVSGSIDRPQVLVNPISAVAPGIFRQIFEFDTNAQTPVDAKSTKARRKARATGPRTDPSIGDALPAVTSPNGPPSPGGNPP
jgi:AsmA-like C-terminal region/Protein of unknown function